jgi:hypothetical protein
MTRGSASEIHSIGDLSDVILYLECLFFSIPKMMVVEIF